MKKFDVKSFAAGVLVGALGLTTAFAATGIKSAALSDTTVTRKGETLAFGKPLVWITMDDEEKPGLYAPVDEVFEKLGYGVHYDSGKNTVDLIPGDEGLQEGTRDMSAQGNVVLNLANHAGQRNIAESGSCQAEDLFLFAPDGREQRVAIGSGNISREIPLEKGTWNYNCSGMFTEGGNVKIVGTVKQQ